LTAQSRKVKAVANGTLVCLPWMSWTVVKHSQQQQQQQQMVSPGNLNYHSFKYTSSQQPHAVEFGVQGSPHCMKWGQSSRQAAAIPQTTRIC
jgi:hypothetical protein